MNLSWMRELADILNVAPPPEELACTEQLLVAARMLNGGAADQMTATTVVGVLGGDDVDALRSLVDAIAQDFGLEASVRVRAGSFSVRFSRPNNYGAGSSA